MKTYAIIEQGKVVNLISASEEFLISQGFKYKEASPRTKIGDPVSNGRITPRRHPIQTGSSEAGVVEPITEADYTKLKPMTDAEIDALLDEIAQ